MNIGDRVKDIYTGEELGTIIGWDSFPIRHQTAVVRLKDSNEERWISEYHIEKIEK
tara:strand:+ start:3703 stop:3870 length:168 start_codon:yes stop_codon:yes gene_type:complete